MRACMDEYDKLRNVVSLLLLEDLRYYCQAVGFRPEDAFVRHCHGCEIETCVEALQALPLE